MWGLCGGVKGHGRMCICEEHKRIAKIIDQKEIGGGGGN